MQGDHSSNPPTIVIPASSWNSLIVAIVASIASLRVWKVNDLAFGSCSFSQTFAQSYAPHNGAGILPLRETRQKTILNLMKWYQRRQKHRT